MTSNALRVLALAYRRLDQIGNADTSLEQNLVFLGLVGMIDPPREEAKNAIKICRDAGIKVAMITGDHPNTAIAIAKELNLYESGVNGSLTGRELDAISETELTRLAGKVAVLCQSISRAQVAHCQGLKAKRPYCCNDRRRSQ